MQCRRNRRPSRRRCFNAHPPRRMDATRANGQLSIVYAVSILIHPEGWMQHMRTASAMPWGVFQSSSTPKDGCNDSVGTFPPRNRRFNPHPPRGMDAMIADSDVILNTGWFQPSSTPKDGCNAVWNRCIRSSRLLFQPSATPKDGCNGSTRPKRAIFAGSGAPSSSFEAL